MVEPMSLLERDAEMDPMLVLSSGLDGGEDASIVDVMLLGEAPESEAVLLLGDETTEVEGELSPGRLADSEEVETGPEFMLDVNREGDE